MIAARPAVHTQAVALHRIDGNAVTAGGRPDDWLRLRGRAANKSSAEAGPAIRTRCCARRASAAVTGPNPIAEDRTDFRVVHVQRLVRVDATTESRRQLTAEDIHFAASELVRHSPIRKEPHQRTGPVAATRRGLRLSFCGKPPRAAPGQP